MYVFAVALPYVSLAPVLTWRPAPGIASGALRPCPAPGGCGVPQTPRLVASADRSWRCRAKGRQGLGPIQASLPKKGRSLGVTRGWLTGGILWAYHGLRRRAEQYG